MVRSFILFSMLRYWLLFLSITCVLYTLFLWGAYGLSIGAYGLTNVSLYTVMCIVNVVGIVYVFRGLRFGIYLSFACSLLFLLTSIFVPGVDGMPIYVSLAAIILTMIGLLSHKNGKCLWAQMKEGIDILHFRHIYQLSVFLIIVICGYWIYIYVAGDIQMQSDKSVAVVRISNPITQQERQQLLKELNLARITLGELAQIEEKMPDISSDYKARIMGLRHILAGHICSDIHDVKAFEMAYKLRKDALSQEQQSVLDWFFRQTSEVRFIWQESKGVSDLATFQRELRKVMKKREIKEL